MCDEVIFRERYLHTVEDLQIALEGGEIVPNRQRGYTEEDLLPHCCLCPVDLAQTAAKNGMRLCPSPDGEGQWILSDEDSQPEQGVMVKKPLKEQSMNTINDGGTAFPVWELNGKGQPEMTGFGMSLRDYFAAKAMAAFIAEPVNEGESGTAWRWASQLQRHTQISGPDIFAHAAYMMADAMLKARGRAMTDSQSTHADNCWDWGPKHYECAVGKIEALREAPETLKAENEMLRKALKDADNEMDWLDESIDPCDHSYWDMRRKVKAALAKESSND